jgi:D-alanine--poly(phosphoribitol) ligase subunit 2
MTVEERIGRIFAEALNVEVPAPATDIIASGLLDSLALVTLLFELEQEFGVIVALESLEIEDLSSVRRIAELVQGLLSQGSSPQ